MIYLKDFRDGKLLYDALDSEVRRGILEELLEYGELNLAHFAKKFGVSNGAITAHIKKLYAAGLIDIATSSGVRGTQKICCLAADRIVIDFNAPPKPEGKIDSAEIGVGCYVDYDIHPTCGLATREKMLGGFDDPACFSYPERVQAGIVWFSYGYLEYLLPNHTGEDLAELRISLELASEAPGYSAHYPSDIHFSINGKLLGVYMSKGEYNDRAGTANPVWWYGNLGQYGKKVVLSVTHEGTFLSGVRVSDVTLSKLNIGSGEKLRFRVYVPEDAVRRGGVTLFGRGFGDYDAGIVCDFISRKKEDK